MPGTTIKIPSSAGGGSFDCYLSLPDIVENGPAQKVPAQKTPAIVLASAVHGVNDNLRALADEFAALGFIAAAPDLFWRWLPGPLPYDDKRLQERSQPRAEKIKSGETDMADTLAHIRTLAQSNGRGAAMGFCYGGPYAILGPKRLGFDAGLSCHGTRMLDYIGELDGVTKPVCIMWGDRDHAAPSEVLDAYRALPAKTPTVEVHIFPGILHGYMMPAAQAFDAKTRAFSMARARAILEGLRGPQAQRKAS